MLYPVHLIMRYSILRTIKVRNMYVYIVTYFNGSKDGISHNEGIYFFEGEFESLQIFFF
jgi:hypothetical protein